MSKTRCLRAFIVMTGCAPSPVPSSVAVGAACAPRDTYACAPSRMEVLVCDARRWRVVEACAGPKHCRSSGSKIECDDTIADLGGACATDDSMACAIDGSALLRCKGGRMTEASLCRGPKRCVVDGTRPTCDRTIAEDGDRCDAESEVACTPKGDAIVECRNHTMVQTTVCRCTVSGNDVRCN